MAIANADGSIVLTTKVDDSGIKEWVGNQTKGINQAANSTKGFSSQVSKTTKSVNSSFFSIGIAAKKLASILFVAFGVKQLVQFSLASAEAATKAEANILRLADIYGSASSAVGEFIDQNAMALGMSKSAAASFSAVYGNLFSVWADQATNAELTNRYLNMTAVVASKTGRTVEDVQERVRSGLLGNTEAIEDLGIFVNVKTIEMTDAFKRMANGKSWEQLDAYTQQQIRTMAILEQATQKYGTEVAQTSALSRSSFSAAYEDFKVTWGEVVNVVLIPILEWLTEIFNAATRVINYLREGTDSVAEKVGNIADSTGESADNQEDLNKELDKTNKSTKKAIASFDDIQILSRQISENLENNKDKDLSEQLEKFGDASKDANKDAKEIPEFFQILKVGIGAVGEVLEISLPIILEFYNEFIVPLKEIIGDAFLSVLQLFVDILVDFASWARENPEAFETIATIILGFLGGLWVYNTTKNIATFISTLITKFIEFGGLSGMLHAIGTAINSPAVALGALIAAGLFWVQNWEDIKQAFLGMESWQQIIFIVLGLAAAIAVLWVAISGGAAAATILLGLSALGLGAGILAVGAYNESKKVNSIPSGQSAISSTVDAQTVGGYTIPKLAQGMVIPPQSEFLAILGDQRSGVNIETPLDTMVEAFRTALQQDGGYGSQNIVIELDGREFGRAVIQQGSKESRRIGSGLVVR